MWSPKDEISLPTQRERILATVSINTLKRELARPGAKVRELKREIFRRMAWLAPIRRVPADVLSHLFIAICRDNWMAPLTLGAVNRHWRDVLISTPRVWASIQITPDSPHFHHELVDIWLSRCGVLPLHISLHPLSSPAAVSAVCGHGRSIECLSFFNNYKQLQGRFPELKELRLGPREAYRRFKPDRKARYGINKRKKDIEVSDHLSKASKWKKKNKGEKGQRPAKNEQTILDRMRFPKLVSLHLHSPSINVMAMIAHKPSFPPLQELHIHVHSPHWLQVVECCANSLIKLTIEYTSDYSSYDLGEAHAFPIPLRCLRHLSFIVHSHAGSLIQCPQLETPQLESYHEANQLNHGPIYRDAASVTSVFLELQERVEWSCFPRVTHLRIRNTPGTINHQMAQLEGDRRLCPDLEVVECIPTSHSIGGEALTTQSLGRRSRLTGKRVDLQYRGLATNSGPGHYMCYTYCKCATPEQGQRDIWGEERAEPRRRDYNDSDDDTYGIRSYDSRTHGDYMCSCGEWHDWLETCGNQSY